MINKKSIEIKESEWIEFDINEPSTYPKPNKDLIFLFKANPTLVCHGSYFIDEGKTDVLTWFSFSSTGSVLHTEVFLSGIKCYAYVTVGHFLKYKKNEE